jgi:hypothetical protein
MTFQGVQLLEGCGEHSGWWCYPNSELEAYEDGLLGGDDCYGPFKTREEALREGIRRIEEQTIKANEKNQKRLTFFKSELG